MPFRKSTIGDVEAAKDHIRSYFKTHVSATRHELLHNRGGHSIDTIVEALAQMYSAGEVWSIDGVLEIAGKTALP